MGTVKKAVLVHGWTYSLEKYENITNLLTKKGLKTELLKVPGLTEKINKPWTIDNYVSWLKYETDNIHNKFILIGHSNGGRIAANFAIEYPEIIDRLILIDSSGIYHEDLAIKTKKFVFKKVAKIAKKITTSETLRNLLYKIVGESDYKNANPIMRKTMTNLINSDKSLKLDKMKVKTLIIWGKEDKIIPLSDGKIMNKLIKNSKLFIIKGAKHSPHFTHAEEVTDIIIKNI